MNTEEKTFMQELEKLSIYTSEPWATNVFHVCTFIREVFEGMRILCSSLRVQGIGDHLLNHWGHPKGRDGVPTITHWMHLTEAHECKTLQTGQQQRIQLSGALPFVAAPEDQY